MPAPAHAIDLRRAAAESSAGELNAEEQAVFAAAAASDPGQQQAVRFWSDLRQHLACGDPPAQAMPAADFSAAVLQHCRQQPTTVVRNRARATPLLFVLPRLAIAASAAGIGVLVGWNLHPAALPAPAPTPTAITAPVAYQEDGASIERPDPAHDHWPSFMRLAAFTQRDVSRSRDATDVSVLAKPWMGLWSKPVALTHTQVVGVETDRGEEILRIAKDGPAYRAGIRPGDILLTWDGCALKTSHCLADHLANLAPGDWATITYWSWSAATVRTAHLQLSSIVE